MPVEGNDVPDETGAGFPMPRPTDAVARSSNDGGCVVSSGAVSSGGVSRRRDGGAGGLLMAGLVWLVTRTRGRRNQRS
jgi:hypothetical protein